MIRSSMVSCVLFSILILFLPSMFVRLNVSLNVYDFHAFVSIQHLREMRSFYSNSLEKKRNSIRESHTCICAFIFSIKEVDKDRKERRIVDCP